MPAVVTGEHAFGFSGIVSVLQAREQGLPVTAIAPPRGATASRASTSTRSWPAAPRSRTPATSRAGRSPSTSSTARSRRSPATPSRSRGGNPDNVNFVEMSLPDAVTALGSGQAQAFVCGEPFCTLAQDAGARVVWDNWLDLVPDGIGLSGVYFSTTDRIGADPQLFEGIQAGILESLDHAREHPDEWRAQIPEYTEIDPALVERLTMPLFESDLTEEEFRAAPEKAVEYGILDGEVPSIEEFSREPQSGELDGRSPCADEGAEGPPRCRDPSHEPRVAAVRGDERGSGQTGPGGAYRSSGGVPG
ncbi:ABC transporter substrate-binding protein [Geodermatophilus sp. SYSU D00703]